MTFLLGLYLLGVIVALWLTDDRWPARAGLAVLWPLGPIAFVVVVVMLLGAAVILWPVPLLTAGAIIAALTYAVGC